MKKLKTTYHRTKRKSNPKSEITKRNKTCDECPSTFSTSNGLAQHKKIHKKLEESDYKCSICGETFHNAEKFRKHMFMHDVKLYKCESCGASFKYLQSYMRHLRDYPQPHYFPCEKCNKVFKRLIFLNKHYCNLQDKDKGNNSDIGYSSGENEPLSHLSNELKCKECDWLFTSEFTLQRHLEIYPEKHFLYPCCSKPFQKNSDVKNHVCDEIKINIPNIETEEKRPYKCNNCSASFFRLPSLRNHLKKYPRKHDFLCRDCKKRFPDSPSLEKHLCIFKNNQDFKCSCLKSFESMQKFRNHVGNQRPYTCCACKIKCITFNNLINHIRTHTKEKPFPCTYCDKSFSVKQTLRLHLRNHLGEKPYKCSKCNYSSSTKWNLQLHEKRHDPNRKDDKTFLCNECGAMFYMKHHLRRHILTHGQEKNHLCKICGKLFSQGSYLNKHLEIHKDKDGSKCPKCDLELGKNDFYKHHVDTGHFLFVCDPCKKVFVSKNNLQRHLKSHSRVVDQKLEGSDGGQVHLSRESWGKQNDAGKFELSCVYCDKTFLNKENLKHHIQNIHKVPT